MLEVTDKDFDKEVLNSDKPVIVDLWAPWCGPCKAAEPVMKKLSETRKDIKVCKVNVDDNMNIISKYNVRSVPTFLTFKSGELQDVLVGFSSERDILNLLDRM
jgi:thioredoxin 1